MKLLYFLYFCTIFSLGSIQEPPCSKLLSIDISGAVEISKGMLLKDNITFEANQYYKNERTTWGCICEVKKCIRKCCKPSEILVNNKCFVNNGSRSLESTLRFYNNTEEVSNVAYKDFYVLYGKTCRDNFTGVQSDESGEIFVQSSGVLFYRESDWDSIYDVDLYCIDILSTSDEEDVRFTSFWCEEENIDEEMQQQIQREVNGIGMIISMPFLLITFLVYFILPEKTLHRRALMCYVLNALGATIILVVINFSSTQENTICHILGYLTIFLFLHSFFWLNVMCVDMWLTFSGTTGFLSKQTAERKKIIIYSSYAFGLSALFTFTVFFLNTYGERKYRHHPHLGAGQCFLGDGLPTFYYFYLPIGILIGINIMLFISTSVKICRIKNETRVLKRQDSKIHSHDEEQKHSFRFNLYLKLMFAMGINWTMELLSWAVEWKLGSTPKWIFYATDFTNALYGVLIFLIFVFKKKIWRSLKIRYYVFIGQPHLAPASSSRGARSSSLYTDTAVSEARTPKTSYSAKSPEQIPLNSI